MNNSKLFVGLPGKPAGVSGRWALMGTEETVDGVSCDVQRKGSSGRVFLREMRTGLLVGDGRSLKKAVLSAEEKLLRLAQSLEESLRDVPASVKAMAYLKMNRSETDLESILKRIE